MENGAHGCANGFGVVRVDARLNKSKIFVAKSNGRAHNGAEIAGVGRVDEDDVWGVGGGF